MKITLPLSLGAAVAVCLAYLHLVPAPQGECSTSSSFKTVALHTTSELSSDTKASCCEAGGCCREGSCCEKGAACCSEGAACCVATAQATAATRCCSAGSVCAAGSACCAASGCNCQAELSMPTACEQSVREAMVIAGDLSRFVDQELSAVLPLVNTESEILQMNFLQMSDEPGSPSPLQPCGGMLPWSEQD